VTLATRATGPASGTSAVSSSSQPTGAPPLARFPIHDRPAPPPSSAPQPSGSTSGTSPVLSSSQSAGAPPLARFPVHDQLAPPPSSAPQLSGATSGTSPVSLPLTASSLAMRTAATSSAQPLSEEQKRARREQRFPEMAAVREGQAAEAAEDHAAHRDLRSVVATPGSIGFRGGRWRSHYDQGSDRHAVFAAHVERSGMGLTDFIKSTLRNAQPGQVSRKDRKYTVGIPGTNFTIVGEMDSNGAFTVFHAGPGSRQ